MHKYDIIDDYVSKNNFMFWQKMHKFMLDPFEYKLLKFINTSPVVEAYRNPIHLIRFYN